MSDITEECRNPFCIRFLYEMTIVGRDVWSDDSTSDSLKLEALKWINEINHRVLGAYGNSDYAIPDLEEAVSGHAQASPLLGSKVSGAWIRAAQWVSKDAT